RAAQRGQFGDLREVRDDSLRTGPRAARHRYSQRPRVVKRFEDVVLALRRHAQGERQVPLHGWMSWTFWKSDSSTARISSRSASASSSSESRSLRLGLWGVRITTRTYWSPLPYPLVRCSPLPR